MGMMMTMIAATTALKATARAFAKDSPDPQSPIQSVAVIEVEALTLLLNRRSTRPSHKRTMRTLWLFSTATKQGRANKVARKAI
jgi:hypothetical protein